MSKQFTIKFWIRLMVFMLFFISITTVYSQKSVLTLEDIYVNNTYSPNRFGTVKWYKNGEGYTSLEQSSDKKYRDIVLYQTKSGERKILVSSSMLISEGSDKPLAYNIYQFSEDGNYLMVFTNTRQVWLYHTRGDYCILNIHT